MKPAAFLGLVAMVVFGYIVYSQHLSLVDLLSPTKFLPSISASPSPTLSRSPRSSDTPVAANSGITGSVFVGPTCPVEKDPLDPQCADKPYQGRFVIRLNGQTATTFMTAKNGSFSVKLAPGTYYINKADASVYPSFTPQFVTVRANQYTRVVLQLDSGIR